MRIWIWERVRKRWWPVPGSVMGRWTVKGLHSSQQTVTRRHGRWQADIFGIQSLVVMIFQLGGKTKILLQVRCKGRTITTTLIYSQVHRSRPDLHAHFHKRGHEAGGQVKVGNVGHQTGVILVHMRGILSSHLVWLAIKAMWWRPKVWVLVTTPWRMFTHSWGRNPLVWMVVGWTYFFKRKRIMQILNEFFKNIYLCFIYSLQLQKIFFSPPGNSPCG